MISAIQEFFRLRIGVEQGSGPDRRGLQLATAALLFEMLHADHEEHPQERRTLEKALREHFGLNGEELRDLADLAAREANHAVSLYPFTGLIN